MARLPKQDAAAEKCVLSLGPFTGEAESRMLDKRRSVTHVRTMNRHANSTFFRVCPIAGA